MRNTYQVLHVLFTVFTAAVYYTPKVLEAAGVEGSDTILAFTVGLGEIFCLICLNHAGRRCKNSQF